MNDNTLVASKYSLNKDNRIKLPTRLIISYCILFAVSVFLLIASVKLAPNTADASIYLISSGLVLILIAYSATIKYQKYERLQFSGWKLNHFYPYLINLKSYTMNGSLGRDFVIIDVVGNFGKVVVLNEGFPVEKECYVVYNADLTEPIVTYRLLEEKEMLEKVSRFEEPSNKYYVIQVPLHYYRRKDQL